jgi:hypothetical protein
MSPFSFPFGGPPIQWGASLNGVKLIWDFKLYVVGFTKDDRGEVNGTRSNETYVGQSTARWKFNGTGMVGAPPNYPWTSTGAGVTAVSSWGAPDTGPKVSGDRFNDVVDTAGWQ